MRAELKFILALIFVLMGVFLLLHPIQSYQSFDNNFHATTDLSEHYSDVAWCKPSGSLGCVAEYWDKDAGCEIDGDEVVIYYYNESVLLPEDNSVYQHVYNTLTNSYLYKETWQQDGIVFFESSIDMKNVPHYLACVRGGNKVVCIGGNSLNKVEQYSKSIVF